jgi:hypothetical protein
MVIVAYGWACAEPGDQSGSFDAYSTHDGARTVDAGLGPMDVATPAMSDVSVSASDIYVEDLGSLDARMHAADSLPPAPDGAIDAALRSDYALVNDPLELDNQHAFQCDPERVYWTPSRIWRLTNGQFKRLTEQMIGHAYTQLGTSNPFDGIHSGNRYSQLADDFGMDTPTFDLLRQNATAIADFMTHPERLWLLPPCVGDEEEIEQAPCLREVMGALTRILWRRPAKEEELERYTAVALRHADAVESMTTIRLLIDAVVMSPHTYFRVELGTELPDEMGRHPLTNYELATALAFGILDGPPDEILYGAAEDDQLETTEQIRRQVRRLLNRRDERRALPRFFQEFFGHKDALNVFKDPVEFPNLDVGSTVRSADHTIDYLVRRGGDSLVRLLTSNIFVPDQPLTCASCVDAETLGEPGVPTIQDPTVRAGMLTHPAWLIAHSRNDETDPVGRGKFIRENLLCQAVPAVPPDVDQQIPQPRPNATMRERLAAHSAPACNGCHRLMDPIGLVFETYSHIGFLQTGPNSIIDPSGDLIGAGDVDGPVVNALDLTERLSRSSVVRQCFTRNTFRFFMGRSEQRGDGCALTSAQDYAVELRNDFSQLVTALFISDTFRYRRQAPVVEAEP